MNVFISNEFEGKGYEIIIVGLPDVMTLINELDNCTQSNEPSESTNECQPSLS